ncbi:MAG TPA: alpha-hydroxy acid oxidase [Steroidobacteraceae bacterium]|nr:alpha-hydroxy acid oxidase [Steroidobacteraceae bacterium]
MNESKPLNVFDYELIARRLLPPAIWDYICAGADDEVTLARNRYSFEKILLRPNALVDVSRVDTSTNVLGHSIAAPILIAPTGQHAFVSPEAEIATARAAAAADTILIASTSSSRSIEEIAGAATCPLWFQLYLFRDRDRSAAMVKRAEATGCRAIALTVDAPRWGRKERSLRTEDALPWRIGNLEALPPTKFEYPDGAPATWADVAWLRKFTKLPIVLKGILTAEDALQAANHGVEAVVVSNHGGRQLDGALASIDALPEIAAAVGDKLEVYLDSGIRRGTDVLKSLALGARAILVGRPVLWGLAVHGAEGAQEILRMLQNELTWAMALSGRPTIPSIDRKLVRD